ncbi:TRAP transporter fused permease subunit [Roseococcus sp. SYP-B2431]|uniref:TRAP transporter permease n=1 Tax=Roseococcus sp. SYP-B2431 TaxID=2496640 RepID=UPI00103D86A6|nr:TRAP transporter fused permease subunit [Roseococcus sp. SYP-B2431]TCI00230.1 TRAP transporter fused permease subunit [Roseococcus sp. SYP-B2431]
MAESRLTAEVNTAIDDMEFANARRELGGIVGMVWRFSAAVFVLFHLWILLVQPVDPTVSRAIHVFFGAALGFALFSPRATATTITRIPLLDWALIAACIAIPFHYILDADGIEMRSFMGPNTMDLLVAGAGMLLVLEFARRTAGLVMPMIAIVFIAYCFVGPWLPGILFHRGVTFDQLLVELFGNNGVLGTIVQVSASFIIMFVVFATFLQTSKAGDYFNDVALAAVGRLRGGPAKVTVLSGLMFGAISGSAVANVVASGAFTIPMMRRVGYDRPTAAAIEATSSTGGQITPPVMGAGAFIMAEVLGIPYMEIALAGLIPALLFYIANYIHCDLNARKLGIRGLPRNELPRWTHLARRFYMATPLVLLIYMLVLGYSPFRAAAWGIAAALTIMFATTLIHRVFLQREGLVAGALGGVAETIASIYATLHGSMREVMQLIAVCAAAGVVAGVIGVTGVGGRFATMLLDIAGASSLLAMVFAMIVAIVLGMGVPTTAAYAIAAAVVAPGLIRIGVEPLVAHMFIFYFAILSAITPPVALASFAAASMARADMWKTSVIALKLGLATFIVPFMFWLSPSLLAQGPLGGILISFVTASCGVYLLACSTEGWMQNGPLALPLRLLSGAGGLMLMIPEGYTDLAGFVIGVGLLLWQRRLYPTEATLPRRLVATGEA